MKKQNIRDIVIDEEAEESFSHSKQSSKSSGSDNSIKLVEEKQELNTNDKISFVLALGNYKVLLDDRALLGAKE